MRIVTMTIENYQQYILRGRLVLDNVELVDYTDDRMFGDWVLGYVNQEYFVARLCGIQVEIDGRWEHGSSAGYDNVTAALDSGLPVTLNIDAAVALNYGRGFPVDRETARTMFNIRKL